MNRIAVVQVERLIRQTEKAALLEIDGDEVWIPWSMIDENSTVSKVGDQGIIFIPEWLAQEKELEYELEQQ